MQKGIASILFLLIGLIVGGSIVGLVFYFSNQKEIIPVNKSSEVTESKTTTLPSTSTSKQNTLTKKSSVSSALPLGDQKYSTSAKKGYIYSCQKQFEGGGANQAGPWINQTAKTWDLTKKLTVDGNVSWPNAKWTINSDGTTRTLSGNGLPSHNTGVYPISSSDDVYQYDRNPNSIKEQSLSVNLPTNPSLLSTPECVGGEVGIMLSGIPIFNGFDAGGRDAVAWEVQDNCGGHPQVSGQYHYHGLSKCLKDEVSESSSHSSLLGYALDGFGIYGIKGEGGIELSTEDLDECHGHTHEVSWNSKSSSIYHYHMSYDFPYSVGCFKAKKAVQGPLGGGMQTSTGEQGQRRPPMPGGKMPPQN